MNREILKSMDTDRIPVERLISLLQTFTLKHAARALPDLLETADAQNATNRQFLLSILETEVKAGMNAAGKGTTRQLTFLQTSDHLRSSIRRNLNPASHRLRWTG